MKKNNSLTVKELPLADRPYEKYLKYGGSVMSDSELLAMVIKTGTKDNNCLELSKQLLSKHSSGLSGFEYLASASIDELMQHSGIGKIKAVQIKAIVELANRIASTEKLVCKITTPKDVYDTLGAEMSILEKEEMRVIILDIKNTIKSIVVLAKGAINTVSVSVKEVLSEPIKQMASGIILVHNHPSGDATPSRQDILFTKKIFEAVASFDIELKDHIVIGKGKYTSIREIEPKIFIRGRLI